MQGLILNRCAARRKWTMDFLGVQQSPYILKKVFKKSIIFYYFAFILDLVVSPNFFEPISVPRIQKGCEPVG